MRFTEVDTRLDGPRLLEPKVWPDERGFFAETYRRSDFMALGIQEEMVQHNHSRSTRGVVRGIHFTVGRGAGKVVRCGRGEIWDVLVDLRRGSPSYGHWEGYTLSEENMRLLYCPPGFGHGFCVVSEVADVMYLLDAYYDTATEREISPLDPDVGIEWPLPVEELLVSDRDRAAPALASLDGGLPFAATG